MDSRNKTAQQYRSVADRIGLPSKAVYLSKSPAIRSVFDGDVETCGTLIVILPLYQNPTDIGNRDPVEPEKIELTEREIREYFSGYTKCLKEGWYRDEYSGYEYFDQNIQYDIDAPLCEFNLDSLTRWKCSLEYRFKQRSIYMKLLGPVLRL
jgi:hypothetical protein